MITLPPLPPAPTHLHLPRWRHNAYTLAATFTTAKPHTALTPAPDGWPEPEDNLHTTNGPPWRNCEHPTRYDRKPAHCHNTLGYDTSHPGVAYCKPHGGNRGIGLCTGAWIMGHAFADITGTTTPWDALEMATQIAANKVIAIQQELGRRLDSENLTLSGLIAEGGYTTQGGDHPDLPELMKLDVMWFDRLTKVAKWSIDAGLGERLVAQIETDSAALAMAARKAVEELGYDTDRQTELLAAIGRNLRAIEAGDDPTIIEGTTT